MLTIETFGTDEYGNTSRRPIGLQPELLLPEPQYTDTLHNDRFTAAVAQLDIRGPDRQPITPTYNPEKNRNELHAPEGWTFRVGGMFYVSPDGSDIDWGYGRPIPSLAVWQHQHDQFVEDIMEEQGVTRSQAIAFMDEWQPLGYDPNMPDLEVYHGRTLSLSFGGKQWGSVVSNDPDPVSSDQHTAVSFSLDGYREYWLEQAQEFVRLPVGADGSPTTLYEFGMPGAVPCWKGTTADGTVSNITIELAPESETNEHDSNLPTMQRLWVPERVRHSLVNEHRGTIDQGGDHQTRDGLTGFVRTLGELTATLTGLGANPVDSIAQGGPLRLMVIPESMAEQVPLEKIVDILTDVITEDEATTDPRQRAAIRQHESERERRQRELANRIIVVSGCGSAVLSAIARVGLGSEWADKYIRNGRC